MEIGGGVGRRREKTDERRGGEGDAAKIPNDSNGVLAKDVVELGGGEVGTLHDLLLRAAEGQRLQPALLLLLMLQW